MLCNTHGYEKVVVTLQHVFHFSHTLQPRASEGTPLLQDKGVVPRCAGRVHTRLMLTPGYLPDLDGDDVPNIRRGLTYRMEQCGALPGQERLFDADPCADCSQKVREYVDKFWRQMCENGKIDAARDSYDKAEREARRLVDVNTIKHTDAREVGAENVCLQAIRELQIDALLRKEGWTERKIDATLASLIVRTIYSPSEWKALRILDENSSAMELLTGTFGDSVTQREVYGAAPALYALKDKLEHHLCHRTDSLFNLTNRVMLFDLTNFYFEGSKQGSKKAKFGRSKEKRYDCRLLVLALAINTEGFIRYSSILEGNTSDPDSLPDMIDKIIAKNPVSPNPDQKVLVVIDAGIATEKTLKSYEPKTIIICASAVQNSLTTHSATTAARSQCMTAENAPSPWPKLPMRKARIIICASTPPRRP